jgi:hypothetical protein
MCETVCDIQLKEYRYSAISVCGLAVVIDFQLLLKIWVVPYLARVCLTHAAKLEQDFHFKNV